MCPQCPVANGKYSRKSITRTRSCRISRQCTFRPWRWTIMVVMMVVVASRTVAMGMAMRVAMRMRMGVAPMPMFMPTTMAIAALRFIPSGQLAHTRFRGSKLGMHLPSRASSHEFNRMQHHAAFQERFHTLFHGFYAAWQGGYEGVVDGACDGAGERPERGVRERGREEEVHESWRWAG